MRLYVRLLLFIVLSLLSSCSFFRSMGLYNTPPPYSESFEEITGKKFIGHANKKENLVLKLETPERVFSPYDTVEVTLKIFNKSVTDTMYLNNPEMQQNHLSIFVTDSAGNKIKVSSYEVISCPMGIGDEYGRIIRPNLTLGNFTIPPLDSITSKLKFIAGNLLYESLWTMLSFKRENIPGRFKMIYSQPHEEYDEIKGPVYVKISSEPVFFNVADYSEEEKKIKDRVVEIIKSAENKADSVVTDSLITSFVQEHPGNIYISQLRAYRDLFSVKSVEKKNTNSPGN